MSDSYFLGMSKRTTDRLITVVGILFSVVIIAFYEMNYNQLSTYGYIAAGFLAPRFVFTFVRLVLLWQNGRLKDHMDMATLQFSIIKNRVKRNDESIKSSVDQRGSTQEAKSTRSKRRKAANSTGGSSTTEGGIK